MSTPTEPGFYWRRVMHFGDHVEAGWRWVPGEVYWLGDTLMTNGHELRPGIIVWGPRIEPPPEPTDGVTAREQPQAHGFDADEIARGCAAVSE